MNQRTAMIAFLIPTCGLAAVSAAQPFPAVPVPPQNQITESKRVLGKILFWDEQLSADGTVACATCHLPQNAGTDPRLAREPGSDDVFNTPDDVFASPGVIRSDEFHDYLRDLSFGLAPQVTGRTANSAINAAFAPSLFWDGRADGSFEDPQSGQTLIPFGGALENQAIAPIMSGVEMGHDGIDWSDATSRIASAKPLALATGHTADVAAVLAARPSYGDLFAAAFGDPAVTPARIAMAIATYERTLIADDTPWDRFIAGQPNAMTPGQVAGWNTFNQANCNACHLPPLFTGNGFRNIGLRPPTEDNGRQGVTGLAADAGRFKVPGLRNVGLKTSFMHNGQFTTLLPVLQFYARQPGAATQFQQNIDPIMATVRFPPQQNNALIDFLSNGLLDARVRDGVFPFDRMTLYSQRLADRPQVLGGTGTPGSGGVVPQIVAADPPMIGNDRFRIGLDRALGGATARLVVSSQAPVAGRVSEEKSFGPMVIDGIGPGNGFATAHWALTRAEVEPGQTVWAQWIIADPSGAGGESLSSIATLRFFCPIGGCEPLCPADFDASFTVTVQDLYTFLASWSANLPGTDFNGDGARTVQDIYDFLSAWNLGCD